MKKLSDHTAVAVRYLVGFTIAELLLLVVGIAIVATFLVPAFAHAKELSPSFKRPSNAIAGKVSPASTLVVTNLRQQAEPARHL